MPKKKNGFGEKKINHIGKKHYCDEWVLSLTNVKTEMGLLSKSSYLPPTRLVGPPAQNRYKAGYPDGLTAHTSQICTRGLHPGGASGPSGTSSPACAGGSARAWLGLGLGSGLGIGLGLGLGLGL